MCQQPQDLTEKFAVEHSFGGQQPIHGNFASFTGVYLVILLSRSVLTHHCNHCTAITLPCLGDIVMTACYPVDLEFVHLLIPLECDWLLPDMEMQYLAR